jgi:hypothetical protein
MPTTTNYGWTTPADTDLVKDGASAIRTLGTAIDTTVFNNASAGIAKTIVDAKGDIIAATAADTVSRLAVGSNDQVLTADSSTATGLKWATPGGYTGSYTAIASGSLSSTEIVFNSLTYNELVLVIAGAGCTLSTRDLAIQLNGNTTASNYSALYSVNNSFDAKYNAPFAYFEMPKSGDMFVVFQLTGGKGTAQKQVNWLAGRDDVGTSTSIGKGQYKESAAITSLRFYCDSGTFNAGTYALFGA